MDPRGRPTAIRSVSLSRRRPHDERDRTSSQSPLYEALKVHAGEFCDNALSEKLINEDRVFSTIV